MNNQTNSTDSAVPRLPLLASFNVYLGFLPYCEVLALYPVWTPQSVTLTQLHIWLQPCWTDLLPLLPASQALQPQNCLPSITPPAPGQPPQIQILSQIFPDVSDFSPFPLPACEWCLALGIHRSIFSWSCWDMEQYGPCYSTASDIFNSLLFLSKFLQVASETLCNSARPTHLPAYFFTPVTLVFYRVTSPKPASPSGPLNITPSLMKTSCFLRSLTYEFFTIQLTFHLPQGCARPQFLPNI